MINELLVIIGIALIGFAMFKLFSALAEEKTHCDICGRRLQKHGYDELLMCPNWTREDHMGKKELGQEKPKKRRKRRKKKV